jgi:hypothetical protein
LFYKADTDPTESPTGKNSVTLSLRLLTRILSKEGEVNVKERIQEIVNNPTLYPVFQTNADAAKVDITGISPLMPPIARPQDFTTGRAASDFFVQTLKANNDPRVPMFLHRQKI